MPQASFSKRSLLELIDLFEQSAHGLADADGQRLHGVPGWDLQRRAALSERVRAQWLQRIGYAGSFPAEFGDEQVSVEVEEDDDPAFFRYRCPESFRTRRVEAGVVGVFEVHTHRFLNALADLLGIPQAHRSGITAPAIGGVLWRLGKMRVGETQVDAWMARGLVNSAPQVFDHLLGASLPDQGLVFSSGQALPELVRPPRTYRVIPLAEVLVDHAPKPLVDADLIHRLLLAPAGSKLEKSLPVHFDPITSTLTIATRPLPPWLIKGARHAAVVKHLFEQFQNGRPWVPAHEILGAVFGPKKNGRSQRIQNVFSGNQVWEDYIASDGDGQYGFKLD